MCGFLGGRCWEPLSMKVFNTALKQCSVQINFNAEWNLKSRLHIKIISKFNVWS